MSQQIRRAVGREGAHTAARSEREMATLGRGHLHQPLTPKIPVVSRRPRRRAVQLLTGPRQSWHRSHYQYLAQVRERDNLVKEAATKWRNTTDTTGMGEAGQVGCWKHCIGCRGGGVTPTRLHCLTLARLLSW